MCLISKWSANCTLCRAILVWNLWLQVALHFLFSYQEIFCWNLQFVLWNQQYKDNICNIRQCSWCSFLPWWLKNFAKMKTFQWLTAWLTEKYCYEMSNSYADKMAALHNLIFFSYKEKYLTCFFSNFNIDLVNKTRCQSLVKIEYGNICSCIFFIMWLILILHSQHCYLSMRQDGLWKRQSFITCWMWKLPNLPPPVDKLLFKSEPMPV